MTPPPAPLAVASVVAANADISQALSWVLQQKERRRQDEAGGGRVVERLEVGGGEK